jgi:uncharacterized protein with HEPN domain
MPKAQREAALLLADIDKAIGRIRLYIAGMDAEAFEASFITFDATVMNLQVIGESVAKLPDTLKSAVAEPPPWGQIIAVRNLVSHGYPDIDPDVIWTIVTTRLEELELALTAMSAALEAGEP